MDLQIAQEHDPAGTGLTEESIDELERVERVGAGGDPAVLHVDQALSGGPGMEVAVEGGAGGGDFRFGAGLLGTDGGEAGVTCPQIGG
ncbi:MAG: hypothetical protein NTW21_43960 [Verrucomicrobia bacterium]|nr:hypothetical protein [Verrucomicrobiota bacterium]